MGLDSPGKERCDERHKKYSYKFETFDFNSETAENVHFFIMLY